MFSSRLGLSLPRFFWRGRWFWGAWLLIFLLPLTREEARLHFLGSRFFTDIYDQPWQEHWSMDDATSSAGLAPLERAVWSRVKDQNDYSYYSSYSRQNAAPSETAAGHILRTFPHEKWLHALALHQSLGWGSLRNQYAVGKWARSGESLDPQNAFYPLVLAKFFGDSGRKQERTAALERAANCKRYDDGTPMFKQVALRASREVGISTWSETWRVWSRIDGSWNQNSNQLDQLLTQLMTLSQQELAKALKNKSKAPELMRSALKRSNAMMRVSLLLQDGPSTAGQWSTGAQWARGAWRVARPPANFMAPPTPTASEFMAFARTQNSAPNMRLAQKCAARMRLLAPSIKPDTGLPTGAMFSTPESFWAQVGGPAGFGVLAFGAYLLGWWWFISLLSWRAIGQESKRTERVLPAVAVIVWTLLAITALMVMVLSWMQSPTLARRGPPVGQAEVCAALSLFAFFGPPLLLALWSAVRTVRRHREALALPARAQLEMNLAPTEAFVLSRATGAFVLTSLALAIGMSLWWGYLCWNGVVGYDWLRVMLPKLSPRLVDPVYTSIESPVTPAYCAFGVILIAIMWLIGWRYGTDPTRRPIYHDGLRAWKEALGCILTLTVWVYLSLLLVCHFSGAVFSHRLDIVAQKGEGAFVSGF